MINVFFWMILLVDGSEIRRETHLGCKKETANNGMNYQTQLEPQLVSRRSSINSSISLMVNWWFGFVGGLDSERIPL